MKVERGSRAASAHAAGTGRATDDDEPSVPDDLELPPDAPKRGPLDDETLGPEGGAGDDLDLPVLGGTNDDRDAADLDIGLAIDEPRDGSTAHDDALFEVDLGDAVHDFEDHGGPASADAFEPSAEWSDHDDNALPSTADDGGAEGFTEGNEVDVDENQLPELDSDSGEEFDDAAILAELGLGADEPWEAATEFTSDVPVHALAIGDGCVAAVGSAMLWLDRGASPPRVRKLAERAHGCTMLGSTVWIATKRGLEVVAADGPRVVVARPDIVAIAAAAGSVFALAGTSLLRVDPTSGVASVVHDAALAMGASEGAVLVSSARRSGALERLRGQDGDFEPIETPATVAAALQSGGRIAACGPSDAIAVLQAQGASLLVLRHGRVQTLDVAGAHAVAFHRASAVLIVADSAEGLALLHATADAVEAVTVARVHGRGPDAAPSAIVWDPTREVAIVASSAGLTALRQRVRH
ncbi:MAG: hypothetical protein U0271_17805 [Polyangiaceae bacterium]